MKPTAAVLALLVSACAGPPPVAPPPRAAPPPRVAPAPPEDAEKLACDAPPDALAPSEATSSALPFDDAGGHVVRVDVVGTPEISADQVRGVLTTRAGSELDEATLRADVERIWALGALEDVGVTSTSAPGGVALSIALVPLPKLRNVFVHATDSQEDTKNTLALATGGRFSRWTSESRLREITEQLEHDGYPRATARLGGRRLQDGGVDVCVHVDRGKKILVRNVTFDGNQAVPTSELAQAMATEPGLNTPGGIYRDDALQLSVLKIQALYYDRGRLTTQVSDPRVDIGEDGIDIQIRIDEGPEYQLGKIRFDGDLVTTKRGYARLVHSKSGEVFSRAKLLEDIERIRQMHESERHPDAVVEPQTNVDPEAHRVDLTFFVHDASAKK
jgi:outer membrane protein insertion porin family